MFFKNEHIVKTEADINHVNGKCSGKAKVQIRCQNGLKSDSILKKLYEKGGTFETEKNTQPYKNNRQKRGALKPQFNYKNQWLNQENERQK